MFPKLDDLLPDLLPLVRQLAADYQRGELDTLEGFIDRVRSWWTPERIAATDRVIPGWRAMAEHPHGGNLAHVTAVLVAMMMLPEYAALTSDQRALCEWVIVFHDIAKRREPGRRDHVHPFRSAAAAGSALAEIGFAVLGDRAAITRWSRMTADALTLNDRREAIPDFTLLPEIVAGIRALFGWETPAGMIVRGVLLHQAFTNVEEDPPAAELTLEQIPLYIDAALFPVLRVMMLADCEGWALFDLDERSMWRESTLAVFAGIARMIAYER
jgi:hypothetical protein